MKLELWGGVECTVNRVGDRYFNQLARNGHLSNNQDLEKFAALGFRTLRYPMLWEHLAPDENLSKANWGWARNRLVKMRELQIKPIVGLLHHGSGPRHTHLLDPHFPQKFANYAAAFAAEFPDIDAYTPINEPLTTARFSGLYGLWYPHCRSDAAFVRALLNQCRATVLAMRAVRLVNPVALFLQTEDLGKTHSTDLLTYQATLENQRRWLGLDLLCGKVNRGHPLWSYLIKFAETPHDLDFFLENTCPPDMLGFNYYITSERFIDENTKIYPPSTHGGNGQHSYADIEAVRVLKDGVAGVGLLLKEAWERYHLPLAITETHLGCSREEQLRWLTEIWKVAQRIHNSGIDLRAVTVWALLGSYDWNSLLTQSAGYYEPGVFDVRAPFHRPTVLARCAHALSSTGEFSHPLLDTPGWWQRTSRLLYPAISSGQKSDTNSTPHLEHFFKKEPRFLLIAGANGSLGRAFARITEHRGIPRILVSRSAMDIGSMDSISAALQKYNPWAVVNTAGYVNVDSAEQNAAQCLRENTEGAIHLATACAERGIPFLTFSSDLVFAGEQRHPYVESDLPSPLSVYGQSKWQAEQGVLHAHPEALVVRTSAFFGPWDDFNFVSLVLRRLERGERVTSASDLYVTPTCVPDLVHNVLDLFIDGETGIWHVANPDVMSWSELAHFSARMFGHSSGRIESKSWKEMGYVAQRPLFSALSSERGLLLPPLETSFRKWIGERFLS